MDPTKKKNPLDIYAGTSADLGGGSTPQATLVRSPKVAAPVAMASPKKTSGDILLNNIQGSAASLNRNIIQPVKDVAVRNFNAPMSTISKDLAKLPKNFNNDGSRVNPGQPLVARTPASSYGGGSNASAAIAAPQAANPYAPGGSMEARGNEIRARTAPLVNTPTAADAMARTGALGAAPALVPGMKTYDGRPGGVASSRNKEGVPTYDDASIARIQNGLGSRPSAFQVVSGGPQASTANTATPVALPQAPTLSRDPQALAQNAFNSNLRTARLTRGDARQVINPMSDDAEIIRRIGIAGDSFKGSPSTRNAVMGALSGQLTARNQSSAQFQRSADQGTETGLQGSIQGEQTQQLTRGQLNAQGIQQQGQERLARLQRAPTALADGTLAQIEGSNASAVVGPDGQPVRALMQRAQSQTADPNTILKVLADEKSALSSLGQPDPEKNPDEYAAYQQRLQAIDSKMAPLLGGQQAESPPAPGAQKAPDGKWYVKNKDGGYSMVNQ